MNDTTTDTGKRKSGERSWTQGIVGIIAIVLGIIGLAIMASHEPVSTYLDAIAGIALGVGLIFGGWALLAEYAKLLAAADTRQEAAELGGTTVELFLGGAVVILGILALLRIAPGTLISIQIILIGAGLMLSSAAATRLAVLKAASSAEPAIVQRVAEEIALSTANVRAMAGLSAVILGILGVVGFDPIDLTLVAMIIVGTALLVNGASLGARLAGTLMPGLSAGAGEHR